MTDATLAAAEAVPNWTAILLAITIAGALLALGGIVAALFSSTVHEGEVNTRSATRGRLASEEKGERDQLDPHRADAAERSAEHVARWEARYAAHQIVRPANGNLGDLAALEGKRLQLDGLGKTRWELALAGVGVILSTAGSILSLYV
jgi:hypothetical protein